MRIITTLAAAALIAGSASLAFAQTGTGSGGSTSGGGTGVSGAGSDPSAPRQNLTRPTPNTPAANKRSDDMAPLQGSNVSNPTVVTKKKKRSMDRTYR